MLDLSPKEQQQADARSDVKSLKKRHSRSRKAPVRGWHGHAVKGNKSPEYKSWESMRDRCLNPNSRDYPNYGGRGIRVCSEWDSFLVFLRDMGPRPPGMTLDRKNVNGPYRKSNCRWATKKEQQGNRRIKRDV